MNAQLIVDAAAQATAAQRHELFPTAGTTHALRLAAFRSGLQGHVPFARPALGMMNSPREIA
jgi:hypothetical protein